MNCRVGLDICCIHKKLRLSFHTTTVYAQAVFKCQTINCSLFAQFLVSLRGG